MIDPIDWNMEDVDEQQSGNEFGEYYRSLDAALHMNMETPDSFLDSVPLKDPEQKEHMFELVGLGHIQRECPAGNQYELLETLRRERNRLRELMDSFTNEQDPEPLKLLPYSLDGQEIMDKVGYQLMGILPEYLGGLEDYEQAASRIGDLDISIRQRQDQIRQDIKDNVFHDYGMLKRLYMFNDRDRRFNGLKYLWETWFTQKAIGRACVLMQDTRRLNSQAHHAKLMETVDLESARVTRSLQGNRRTGGGGGYDQQQGRELQ